MSEAELELCDLSDNENDAKMEKKYSNLEVSEHIVYNIVLYSFQSDKTLEKGSVFKRKKRVCLSKEERASLTADELKERKRRLAVESTLRAKARLLASGPVDCDICGETQTSKEALKYHVRTRHSEYYTIFEVNMLRRSIFSKCGPLQMQRLPKSVSFVFSSQST